MTKIIIKVFHEYIEPNGKYFVYIPIILFFLYFGIIEVNKSIELRDNFIFSKALVFKVEEGGKGGAHLYFKYKYNNVFVENVHTFGRAYYSGKDFLNKTFKVAISTKDSSNSKLLLREKDYKKFGLTRPKNLKWIDRF